MKSRKIETVMTYDQWCKLFKKNIKRQILKRVRRALKPICTAFNWFIISLMFLSLPMGMILHWVFVGY